MIDEILKYKEEVNRNKHKSIFEDENKKNECDLFISAKKAVEKIEHANELIDLLTLCVNDYGLTIPKKYSRKLFDFRI